MENKNKKIDFINCALNNILFYNGKLYKIIKANTANLYAFEYILNKKLEINVSIMFYNIGDKVNYYNFLNSLKPQKIKLKLKNILESNYKILYNEDIANIYFIVNIPNFEIKNILTMHLFKDSLFNIDDKKLKDTYDIRTFINAMTTPIMNTPNEYYQKIRGEYLHNKKYFNRKYLTSEIKKLSEDELPFIKSYPIEKYNNIN